MAHNDTPQEGDVMRRLAVALAAASFALAANTSALAADYADTVSAAPSPEAMAVDLLVIRPVGIVATVAGVGLFIASLPIDGRLLTSGGPLANARAAMLVGSAAFFALVFLGPRSSASSSPSPRSPCSGAGGRCARH